MDVDLALIINNTFNLLVLILKYSLAPNFKWAQRKNKVWIKVELPNIYDENIRLDPLGKLSFYGKSKLKGENCYALNLELYSTIDIFVSKIKLFSCRI